MGTEKEHKAGFFRSLGYLLCLIFQPSKGRPLLSAPLIILLVGTPIAVVIAVAGWGDMYKRFLEPTPPSISVVSLPRGIGEVPVSAVFTLRDTGSGLDEVVIRALQRGKATQLMRQKLGGKAEAEITLDFPGRRSGYQEGDLEIQIRVFDRSFWSNAGEAGYGLKVDYRPPYLEVVSSQHNARVGGSQLVFYRAVDENLGISGVQVGHQSFPGFRASSIDPDFQEDDLYVAIYGVDVNTDPQKDIVRVFAEDAVGNAQTKRFYNKVLPRRRQARRVQLSDSFMRSKVLPLAEKNSERLAAAFKGTQAELLLDLSSEASGEPAKKFKLVDQYLRSLDQGEIKLGLANTRFDKQWAGPFVRQAGVVKAMFGQPTEYIFAGEVIGKRSISGYEISMNPGAPVRAANNGTVAFTDSFGVYGRLLAIDHGLGLFSIYAQLDSVVVQRGQTVEAEDIIGNAGESGLAFGSGLLFQMRVGDVEVDPQEWLDTGWYYGHVVGKINEVKRSLGISTASNY